MSEHNIILPDDVEFVIDSFGQMLQSFKGRFKGRPPGRFDARTIHANDCLCRTDLSERCTCTPEHWKNYWSPTPTLETKVDGLSREVQLLRSELEDIKRLLIGDGRD